MLGSFYWVSVCCPDRQCKILPFLFWMCFNTFGQLVIVLQSRDAETSAGMQFMKVALSIWKKLIIIHICIKNRGVEKTIVPKDVACSLNLQQVQLARIAVANILRIGGYAFHILQRNVPIHWNAYLSLALLHLDLHFSTLMLPGMLSSQGCPWKAS